MIDNLQRYRLDLVRLAEGVPVHLETDDGDATIWVRPAHARNVDFAKTLVAMTEELGLSPEAWLPEHQMEAVCRSCVARWEGFREHGAEVEYTPKLGFEVFSGTEEIWELVQAAATDTEAFRLQADTKSD